MMQNTTVSVTPFVKQFCGQIQICRNPKMSFVMWNEYYKILHLELNLTLGGEGIWQKWSSFCLECADSHREISSIVMSCLCSALGSH